MNERKGEISDPPHCLDCGQVGVAEGHEGCPTPGRAAAQYEKDRRRPLSSPSANLLWRLQKGATLQREPLAQGRRCLVDGSHEVPYREVSDLQFRGLIVSLPRENKDEPTRYELTEFGREWPL